MHRRYYWPDGGYSYQVRNGRPVWDWVSEGSLTPDEIDLYKRTREMRGDQL